MSTLQVIRVVAPWIKQYYNVDGANYIIPNIGEHSAAHTLPCGSSCFCSALLTQLQPSCGQSQRAGKLHGCWCDHELWHAMVTPNVCSLVTPQTLWCLAAPASAPAATPSLTRRTGRQS